jgi:hypothetical protein
MPKMGLRNAYKVAAKKKQLFFSKPHFSGCLLFKTLAQWLSKPLPAPVLLSAVP